MKRHLRQLFVIATLTAPAIANHAATSIATEEGARIHEAADPALGTMRAGRDQGAASVQDSERSALKSAESAAPELGEMRGGLDTIEVLLIVVIVLLILILI